MRIATYKVKVLLNRVGPDEVDTQITDEKTFVRSEPLTNTGISELPKLATDIGNKNSNKQAMLKKTLLPGEESREAFVELQYIEE